MINALTVIFRITATALNHLLAHLFQHFVLDGVWHRKVRLHNVFDYLTGSLFVVGSCLKKDVPKLVLGGHPNRDNDAKLSL